MSDLNQKPTDVERQAEVARRAVGNLEIKHEKPDESTLVEFVDCGALVKQEHLEGGCKETCQNVYGLLFDVIKHEIRSESPEIEHQRECHFDTRATITDFSFKDESPGNMKTYSIPEPSQAAVSLPADSPLTLGTLSAKKHTTTELSKIDEGSSVKQNCFNPIIQQTVNKDKTCDNREINRENSTQGSSVARRGDTHISEKPHSCKYCDYKCSQTSSLKSHMRTHTGEKPYSCKYCDYKCSQASSLKSHMRTHTGEKPHSCKYCVYKCSLASSLKRHMRTHTGEKPHSCKYCDYKCSVASHLKSHMRNHTGDKPHSCKYCECKCSTLSHLKRHMRTHTGEKPHSCKYCDYKCSQASHLISHMRTHTGEKPHSCEFCHYKCSTSSHLKRHMRTHTGEKPQSCKYCDFKCSRASTLKSHMSTHTDENPHSCMRHDKSKTNFLLGL